MLIRSLEQFLACAGCSSNVPYCSSPRSSSALMLLCQLLKSDKLSIFSIASQKATNSLATKLLISMVSFPCLSVLSQCIKWADVPPSAPRCHSVSVLHMIHFLTHVLHPKTLCQEKQAAIFVGASLQSQHDSPSWTLSRKTLWAVHSALSIMSDSQHRSTFKGKCGL